MLCKILRSKFKKNNKTNAHSQKSEQPPKNGDNKDDDNDDLFAGENEFGGDAFDVAGEVNEGEADDELHNDRDEQQPEGKVGNDMRSGCGDSELIGRPSANDVNNVSRTDNDPKTKNYKTMTARTTGAVTAATSSLLARKKQQLSQQDAPAVRGSSRAAVAASSQERMLHSFEHYRLSTCVEF